ncbi:MAG TPA: VOC family protein [Solirubrobacteraceae bacterium]
MTWARTGRFAHVNQREENTMLDHVVLGVGDLQRSRSFYEQALRPLGIALLLERGEVVAGFGETGRSYFILRGDREPSQPPLHFAFNAGDHDTVRAFHAAGLAAGGTDNGAPGPRDYAPNYYGAFVLDPDGNNIEAVCHEPE